MEENQTSSTNSTDQITPVEVPQVQDQSTSTEKQSKSITILIDEDKPINIALNGNFKTYEFYGILISTFLDVFSNNLVNSIVNTLNQQKPGPTQDDTEAKIKAEVDAILKKYGK